MVAGQNRNKGTNTPARFVIGGLTLLGSLVSLNGDPKPVVADVQSLPNHLEPKRSTLAIDQFSDKKDSPSQTTYLSEISLHLVHHFITFHPETCHHHAAASPGSDSVGQALGGLQTSNS